MGALYCAFAQHGCRCATIIVVDPNLGYNRTVRKLLHIFGGLGALALPFIPYWSALTAALVAVLLALYLKPQHVWWLRILSKPEDRKRGVITGLRGYCFGVLLLILLWPLLQLAFADAEHFVMLGWLVLSFGDGMAGLVGPHPTKARTVPWNKRKTWCGDGGVLRWNPGGIRYVLRDAVAGLAAQPLAVLIGSGFIIAGAVALVESLATPIDDNYLVGLTATLVAALLRIPVF